VTDLGKRMAVTKASLISQGLIKELEDGIELTQRGYRKAMALWGEVPDDHKLLLSGYIKLILNGRTGEYQ